MNWFCWCLRQHILPYWKSITTVLAPLLLLPIAILGTQVEHDNIISLRVGVSQL